MHNPIFLSRLRILGIIEAISTLFLFFVAMPLKYMAGMPEVVRVAGSVHGMLFVALAMMFIIGREIVPLPTRIVVGGILGAAVPFGPFVTEVWLRRLALR